MKQILQNLRTGATEIAEVPAPRAGPGALLIKTTVSLVSAGTERMLVNFGRASAIEKARQQPDKVRMVLDKIRTDGLAPTLDAVRNKLEQPLALGYCNVGVVAGIGAGVTAFSVGDRVASNGKHAGVVAVPVNLCAKISDKVSDEEAAFTVVGAIALQGIRLARPTIGEAVVVTGLGLIGLLTVQLLRANGCRVLGIDFDSEKLSLARKFGAETVDLSAGQDPVTAAQIFSRDRGVDAVIITASTESNEPVHQAAVMCRQRGRIILVGVTGLELSREDFYKKELTFQVSSSYGPGRYDAAYEEKGQDYPVGFVRWTEQRNFEAVLDLLASKKLDVAPMISHRFPIEEAQRAYDLVAGNEPSLAVLLRYGVDAGSDSPAIRIPAAEKTRPGANGSSAVSFLGAGNFATAVLIPAFKNAGADLRTIASSAGVSGLHAGRKFGFADTTTDAARLFSDPAVQSVVVTTRHDSHARFVIDALRAGKNVFVEKPLCITLDEADAIESAHDEAGGEGKAPLVMVGFNRRFAPQVVKMKSLLSGAPGPKTILVTVNAGAIPPEHWTQDPRVGGGRIIGEACHFVDLARFLAGAPISAFSIARMRSAQRDTAVIDLEFADGSLGAVHYLANGSKKFPKERIEIFAAGSVLQLNNFRRLTGYGWPGFNSMSLWKQDKGHSSCAAAFLGAVKSGARSPIPFAEIMEVSRATIALASD